LKACTGVSEANKEICVAHSIKHRDNYREYAHATLCKFLLSLPRKAHAGRTGKNKRSKAESRLTPTFFIYIIFAFALRTVTYRRITKQKTGQSFPFGLTCFLLSDSGKLARG
ncbi:hypothetical protein AB9L55_27295, partial [Bacillus thuringiensis]